MQAVFLLSAAAMFVPVIFHTRTVTETDSLNRDAPGTVSFCIQQLQEVSAKADMAHLHAQKRRYIFHVAIILSFRLRQQLLHASILSIIVCSCQNLQHIFAGITFQGQLQLVAFCVFEFAVGLFWPSMMKMRSQHVPEEMRATVINLFRVPLNMFVCIVLYNVSLQPPPPSKF